MPIFTTLGAACAKAWGFTSGLITDQYFNLVSLLLPGNGTNGKQNNAFLDSSTNNFTITPNGNTTQGTFSPFSQTGWGNYFEGSSAYLNGDGSAGLALSTGDFTIEFWAFVNSTSGNPQFISFNPASTNGAYPLIRLNTGALEYYVNDTSVITGGSVSTGVWNHIALSRSGTSTKMFLNGTQTGSTYTDTNNYLVGTSRPTIGRAGFSAVGYLNGYISNLRVVKGRAVYTTTFTPPISPLGLTSGGVNPPQGSETKLLTCQSNRFVDAAGTTITVNGSPTVTPFSPFAPTQAYSAAAVGGSGYFDGTGDYLNAVSANTANAMGSGDWTIEAFVYKTNSTEGQVFDTLALSGALTDAIRITILSSGAVSFYKYSTVVTSGGSIVLNTWNHIAVVRQSQTIKIYLNGTQVNTTYSDTGSNYTCGTNRPLVGINGYDNAANPFQGYIFNLRAVKGTAVYTGNFTPPTGQLATSGAASAAAYPSTTNVDTSFASSACSLLLNFTNAGVVDATAKNVLETVGNAQISTTQSKWGGGSIYLDGTSNTYVKGPVQIYLGSSNFTIEGWVRFNSIPGAEFDIYKIQDKNDGSSFGALRLILNSSMKLKFLASTTGSSWGISVDNLGNTLSTGVWYYIAVTRSGSDFKVYVNGSQAGATQTLSGALYAGPINALGWNGVTTYSNMYFDDVRLTVGLVRDVTTSPIAPFPVQ